MSKLRTVSAKAEQAKYAIDLHAIISFLVPANDKEVAQHKVLQEERDRVIAQLVHDINADAS